MCSSSHGGCTNFPGQNKERRFTKLHTGFRSGAGGSLDQGHPTGALKASIIETPGPILEKRLSDFHKNLVSRQCWQDSRRQGLGLREGTIKNQTEWRFGDLLKHRRMIKDGLKGSQMQDIWERDNALLTSSKMHQREVEDTWRLMKQRGVDQ